ncbi:hypothetical protein [Phyllobacterium myrsinacearum]|uniref:Uncharacterized protein n=1 Tax=Phyllobacterium myrsinacearum TaxID=28101 RepID=A0A839EM70_9HYPH|nr:hypothetical protein [Phyllobacterium myrsinacearum]MBA8881653.1 hypothetical protein [Phyllobacterium myrsinacearum]
MRHAEYAVLICQLTTAIEYAAAKFFAERKISFNLDDFNAYKSVNLEDVSRDLTHFGADTFPISDDESAHSADKAA